jgi:hypothetical protein
MIKAIEDAGKIGVRASRRLNGLKPSTLRDHLNGSVTSHEFNTRN